MWNLAYSNAEFNIFRGRTPPSPCSFIIDGEGARKERRGKGRGGKGRYGLGRGGKGRHRRERRGVIEGEGRKEMEGEGQGMEIGGEICAMGFGGDGRPWQAVYEQSVCVKWNWFVITDSLAELAMLMMLVLVVLEWKNSTTYHCHSKDHSIWNFVWLITSSIAPTFPSLVAIVWAGRSHVVVKYAGRMPFTLFFLFPDPCTAYILESILNAK